MKAWSLAAEIRFHHILYIRVVMAGSKDEVGRTKLAPTGGKSSVQDIDLLLDRLDLPLNCLKNRFLVLGTFAGADKHQITVASRIAPALSGARHGEGVVLTEDVSGEK